MQLLANVGNLVTSIVAMLFGSGFVSKGSLLPPPFLHVNYDRVRSLYGAAPRQLHALYYSQCHPSYFNDKGRPLLSGVQRPVSLKFLVIFKT